MLYLILYGCYMGETLLIVSGAYDIVAFVPERDQSQRHRA
jgi:hypothetical protein